MIPLIPIGQPAEWYMPAYRGHWNGEAWVTFHAYGPHMHRNQWDARRWAEARRGLGDKIQKDGLFDHDMSCPAREAGARYKLNDKVYLRQEWGGMPDLPGHVCKVENDGRYSVWAGNQVVPGVTASMLRPRTEDKET